MPLLMRVSAPCRLTNDFWHRPCFYIGVGSDETGADGTGLHNGKPEPETERGTGRTGRETGRGGPCATSPGNRTPCAQLRRMRAYGTGPRRSVQMWPTCSRGHSDPGTARPLCLRSMRTVHVVNGAGTGFRPRPAPKPGRDEQ